MLYTGPISKYFTWEEATHSNTAIKHNISNIPTKIQAAAMRYTAQQMDIVRERFGKPISVSSWLRVLEVNRLVGSKDTSQHIDGEAVDFKIPGIPLVEVYRELVNSPIEYDQLILEATWIHISFVSHRKPRRVHFSLR